MMKDVFGFVKPLVDVHTMGIYTMANLLKDCGYRTVVADDDIAEAVEKIQKVNNYSLLKNWIEKNGITKLCFSYRLDPQEGCDCFMALYTRLMDDRMMTEEGGCLTGISFAGLPDTCELVKAKTDGKVLVFPGKETPVDSLRMYGVHEDLLPKTLNNENSYDCMRWEFAEKVVTSERYKKEPVPDHYGYLECGKESDSYVKRLEYARKHHALPIIRTHSGPYHPNRLEALKEYNSWCKELAQSRLLDVLSIGSSQLTQSNFGEDWEGKPNGGGVPVNSEMEYRLIRENANPMLVRTYSGTKDVPGLARIHERALNISWHALSFWWFNELDGRGPNTLIDNLKEHFEAVRWITTTGKPVEPNVPHHFAFRGCDDITYIISGFLAAKACKKMGVNHLILQNMLNTPKYTWGVQDLAKGRTMLKLVRELEDANFEVSLQSRAGLDYFAPDLEYAKVQLAAVTCLMDDIEPENDNSPEIVHVVNYCEAVRLATPPIIKESIQITLNALHEYRQARMLGKVPNMKYDTDVNDRATGLYEEARVAIELLEKAIPDLYTPEGFYKVFVEGFLPVPYLMDQQNKFPKATQYHTAIKDGGIKVVNEGGKVIDTVARYRKIIAQMN
jgi:CheY-like chemotaxis protein